ncbi:hypothetical protein [Coleofasciculus chthonoplastes]|uniref:hypothetical protein n=1 Tax=Coleofasciculus chthonoplastes TaxID=64178 RepID=UPI0032F84712
MAQTILADCDKFCQECYGVLSTFIYGIDFPISSFEPTQLAAIIRRDVPPEHLLSGRAILNPTRLFSSMF